MDYREIHENRPLYIIQKNISLKVHLCQFIGSLFCGQINKTRHV